MIVNAAPPPCAVGEIQARRGRPCATRSRPWILATAILGSSLAFVESSAVNLALPELQSDLGVSSSTLQWIANLYLLALGSLMLIGGSLGDRIGLRKVFLAGAAVFGAAVACCALAPSVPLLLAARCLEGLGAALLVPASLALVGTYFEGAARGRAIGTWAGASALAAALGPVVGGALVDLAGWRAVFAFLAPTAALTVLFGWRHLPADVSARSGRLDYLGAGLLLLTLAAAIAALMESGAAGQRTAFAAAAALAGTAFLVREKRASAPILPLRLFESRTFRAANIVTLLLYAALGGALYFLPFDLIQVQGLSATQAGAALLPMTLLLAGGSTAAGAALGRLDARTVLAAGPVLCAAGLFGLALPGTHATYVADFFAPIAVLGLGMTVSVAPLTAIVMGSVAREQTGVASGVNNTVSRLAGMMAVAALTALAVTTFTGSLSDELRVAGVPPELSKHLVADASQLADLRPPPDVDRPTAAAARSAIGLAYVRAFRRLMLISGSLALAGALVAWLGLPRLRKTDAPRLRTNTSSD